MSLTIDPRIFRAYDIRGRAPEQIHEDACFQIALAFGAELCERYGKEHPSVCVGRDARVTGAAFCDAVIRGLLESGCEVLAIGQTPSPVNYFTICTQRLDGGMQVTASHNPAHDNGLKLSLREAEAFAGEDIQRLRKRIEAGNLPTPGGGGLRDMDAERPYREYLQQLFPRVGKGLRCVVDSGNGVAGPLYCAVLRNVGAEIVELYTEPDGNFPHHPADPSKHATLREAQDLVREQKADIGLAFDGDGDRLGCIDEEGTIRTADEILLLLSEDHLSRHPGSPIVFTVSNSSVLQTEIAKWGGQPVMAKVGHSFVEHAMRDHQAKLGGEQSGHFFCGEAYFDFDDALVAALRVLSIVQAKKTPLSTLCARFPETHQSPEYRPEVSDEHKGRIIAQATAHFAKQYPVLTLDGARIDFGDGAWAGFRQSNTSPCISICIEARSPQKLQQVEEEVLAHLKGYPEIRWEK